MRPQLYLEIRQFINSIKNTLRSPKRLIPALIIGAWFISGILQSLLLFFGPSRQIGPDIVAINELSKHILVIKMGVFLFLSFGSMLIIYNSFSTGLLIFPIAHIDFLFPTPISKRKILLLKLIKDYVKYGFWVAFFFVFIGSPILRTLKLSLFPDGLISIAAVTALLLFVINIAHTINIVFTVGYERLRHASMVFKGVLIGISVSALAFGLFNYIRTGDSFASLLFAIDSPLIRIAFAPAQWCTMLFLAPLMQVTPEDYLHLGMLWGLAGGSFLLLISRKEDVYEPSLAVSTRFARRKLSMRSGDYVGARVDDMKEKGTKRLTGFTVPAFGLGAIALVWKNLLVKYRMSRGQMLMTLILPVFAMLMISKLRMPGLILHNLPFVMLYMVFVLSMMAQAELRVELKQVNILKSMPIAPYKMMLAQAISSAIYLGAGTLAFALSMWFFIPQARGDLLIMCTIASPFLGFAEISAMIVPSLLYPDTQDAAQNYICGLVGFLLVSVAILPTIILGPVYWFTLGASVFMTVVAVCIVNLIVGAGGIALAGYVFRKYDPTGE